MKVQTILIPAVAFALLCGALEAAADADFMAHEIRCEQQYSDAELPDLIWSQGTTPLIAVRTYERGKPVPPRGDVTVQMMIAPSATSLYWAVVTNQATNSTSYLIQWPTIGTNTTASAPWYYVVYFLRDGHRYWTGSGDLWIEETTATGDGLHWQEIATPDIADLSNRVAVVEGAVEGVQQDLDDMTYDIYGSGGITSRLENVEDDVSALSADYLPKGWTNSGALAKLQLGEGTYDRLEGWIATTPWLTPARFQWEVDSLTTVTTNIGPETDSGWAVLTRLRTVVRESGYAVRPVVERNQWDADLEVVVTGPATLSAVGDGSYTLAWDLGTETGSTATVSGQLGDWRESTTLTMKSAGGVVTQNWFSSFASGGVREDLAGVLSTWTNMGGSTNRFLNFPAAEKDTLESLVLIPDPNFWARNCDLSGVSAWNNDWKYTRNGTLISSNVIYCAGHWAPSVGRTLVWYGKDSQLHSSKVVDQRRLNFDLCVSKISPPLDTNVVTAYPILDLTEIDKKVKAGDGVVYGLPPMPVLAMAKRQAGFIMCSEFTTYGGVHGIFDAAAGSYISNSRSGGVSGDSGHPVFVSTDATNLVLFGCYWRPNVVSTPGADKDLVLSAIEAMGADTNAVVWEAWTNYPTYLGPLPTSN